MESDGLSRVCFVDFDEREITSLEIVFERIKVLLCDFHRELAWHRWTSKFDNGFSHIFDQVKTRLRRISHSKTHADCKSAVKDLMSWECFSQGKLKNWLLKTWLPHIKRWWLAYRPNDLILWNTNNGTDIAYNHKPEQWTYNQSVMRKRLLAQLENETMTPFPQKTKRVKRGKEVTYHFPL